MKIFTVESLRVYYVQDDEIFEEVTGIDLYERDSHSLVSLSIEQIEKLKELEAFSETGYISEGK